MYALECTLRIFILYTHFMYTKYNSLAICTTYRLYTIHNTLILYAVCSAFAIYYAYRIHYKYTVVCHKYSAVAHSLFLSN